MTSVIASIKNKRIGIGIELNKKMFSESIKKNLKNKLETNKIEEFDYDGSY